MITPSRALHSTGTEAKKTYDGIYIASVVNNNDPALQNRVTLKIPQILGEATSNWATPVSSTVTAPPAVRSIVYAQFNGGDVNHPVYHYQVPRNLGTVSLSSGTAVVSSSIVTSSSKIFVAAQDNNTTGALRISARTPGTSFTITSSVGTDHGLVAYEVI